MAELNVQQDDAAASPATGSGAAARANRVTLAARFAAMMMLPILIGTAGGYFGARHMTPIFGAESEIMFAQRDRAEIAEQYLATQALIAQSRTVLQPVASDASTPLAQVQENLSIDFPKSSAIMRIRYIDEDPAHAFDMLQAIIEQYMALTGGSRSDERIVRQLLVPPFNLDEPVRPKPLQLAAIGGVIGLAIAIAGFAVLLQLRERR